MLSVFALVAKIIARRVRDSFALAKYLPICVISTADIIIQKILRVISAIGNLPIALHMRNPLLFPQCERYRNSAS